MSLSVQFESPPGTPTEARQFEPGSSLRVTGKTTGPLGLANSFQKVRGEVSDKFPPLYSETWAGFLGNYNFDFDLPEVKSQASVLVTSYYPLGPPEQVKIPIGIGVMPGPLPGPEPSPWGYLPLILLLGLGLLAYREVKRR